MRVQIRTSRKPGRPLHGIVDIGTHLDRRARGLQQRHKNTGLIQLEMLAMHCDGLAGPKLFDGLQVLLKPRQAFANFNAEAYVFNNPIVHRTAKGRSAIGG